MIALALSTLALAAPAPAKETPQACRTIRCKARVAHRQCSQSRPRACVLHVVYHQRITGWRRSWLLRIPACESTWNPYATNGPHAGLYQFNYGTWAGTPYGHRPIFSAFWQPYAAAWMLDQGRTGEWVCD
jgi:hypothetical protein